MAKPEVVKTDIGQRLIDVRKALNFHDRQDFADALGIPKVSLGNYERGDREPSTELLLRYRENFKVNLNWLFTGRGGMFEESLEGVVVGGIAKNQKLGTALLRMAQGSSDDEDKNDLNHLGEGRIDPAIFVDIDRKIREVYRAHGQSINRATAVQLAINWYNELIGSGSDLHDGVEIGARIYLKGKDLERVLRLKIKGE